MWQWPRDVESSCINLRAPLPMTKKDAALVHIIASGEGALAKIGLGGHSAILVEYIHEGHRHIVLGDIRAVSLSRIGDGFITNVKYVEQKAIFGEDHFLREKFISTNKLIGIESHRISLDRVKCLLNNILQDVIKTAKAVATLFLQLAENLSDQELMTHLQCYASFMTSTQRSGSFLNDPIHSWIARCEVIQMLDQYGPVMQNFMLACAKRMSDSKQTWIEHYVLKLYEQDKTFFDGELLVKNSGFMPYRITGSGTIWWAWHSGESTELDDDPVNCSEWVQKHLNAEDVKINLGTRKSKPAALTCRLS